MLNYINILAWACPRIACTVEEKKDIVYSNPKYEPDSVYSEEFQKSYLAPQSSNKIHKFRGLSPRANYTDRATVACWRS
jgi:hypothetical protein